MNHFATQIFTVIIIGSITIFSSKEISLTKNCNPNDLALSTLLNISALRCALRYIISMQYQLFSVKERVYSDCLWTVKPSRSRRVCNGSYQQLLDAIMDEWTCSFPYYEQLTQSLTLRSVHVMKCVFRKKNVCTQRS